jgi:hypothetical protein
MYGENFYAKKFHSYRIAGWSTSGLACILLLQKDYKNLIFKFLSSLIY